jgi:hypothetical protein
MSYPEPPYGPAFRCPICRSGAFQDVQVKRPDGSTYKTDFRQCSGCSVMFRDSVKFTLFEPYTAPKKSEAERRQEAKRLEFFCRGEGDR